MPPIGEMDAVLIELSREGAAETGFSKREKEKTPKHNLGTPFMYNPELGVMNFSGLSSSKMQIGHWYTVAPSWTEFIEPASHKSVQAVLTADVVKETIPYCETAKTVNETGYRRTYYFGSGMILDVTTEYLLIWNDKLGLVSHFAKNLDQSFMHMQVVKFKALSQCESRHCAFHAVAVEPLYETRFRRLQGSSEAVVKAYGKLLYADCRNGDKVLLLDNEKRLLLIGSNVGLEADEVINVVYYKIQTQQGSVYISGFYFQTGEDQEFWEEQMTRLQGTGKVTDENLATNFLNAPTSKNRLSDDEYCQLWKRNFRFWNPDKEDSSRWITPFLIACRTKVVSKITPPPVQEKKPAVGQEESTQTNHVQSGEMFPMPREETVSTVSSSSDHIPEETLVPIVQPIQPSNPTVSSEDSLTLSSRLNKYSPQPVASVKIVEPAPEPPLKPVESVKAQDALVSASPSKTAAISLDLRVKLNQTRAILWSYLSEKERALRMRMVVQEKTKFDIGYINSLASLEFMNTSHTSIHSGRSTTVSNFSSFTIVDNRTSSNRCVTPGYHPPLHTSSPKYPVINPL